LREVDLDKYPVFKQHSIFENLRKKEAEAIEEPVEFNPQVDLASNPSDEKGPGAENVGDISAELSSISIPEGEDEGAKEVDFTSE
jgi:hypothetical protein